MTQGNTHFNPAAVCNNARADNESVPDSRKFVLTPLAAAIVTALASAGPALAQDDSSGKLEEIVVTASKREMNMQDLAQSINVISTTDIKRQGLQGMEDFVRVLPGVSLASSMPGRNTIVMRGISTGTQEFRTDSQVAMYLDEQPITTISQQLDVRLIDIERVESLPGPQGTLFGSSSQAGTIRFITNKPNTDAASGQIDTGVYSINGGSESYDISGHINLPLSDNFAVRAVGYVDHQGGYIDNVLGTTLEGSGTNADVVENNFNEADYVGGRIAALWNVNENWDLYLSAIGQKLDSKGSWESDPALGDYKVSRFFKETRDDKWYQVSGTIQGDLGFAEVLSTTSYFERDIVYEWDNMVYEQWKDAYFAAYPLYNSDYTYGTTFNDQKVERFAQEFRLTSSGDSRLQWMIGAFYEDVTDGWFFGARNPDFVGTTAWYAAQAYAAYNVYNGYDTQYPLPATDIGYSNTFDKRIKQTAIFGELNYDLTDRWSVSFGARWFEFDRNESDNYQFPQGLPPAGSADTGGTYSSDSTESDTIFKVGTSFQLSDNKMVYFLVSEGFRLGGSNSQRAADTGLVPQRYDPDTMTNYEVGFKSQWLDDRLLINVSVFDMIWDDIQISQFSVGGRWWLRGTINGGKGEAKGAEITTTWNTTENLTLQFSAFFNDAKYTEDIVRFSDVVLAGSPMTWSADRKYNASIDYTINDVFGGNLWLRYDYYYESEKWDTLNNIVANNRSGLVPAYSISNAQIGLSRESGWDVTLIAYNVWDQRAVNWLVTNTNGAFFGDTRFANDRTYAAPRTVGLNFSKRFE
ncbi:MAG: TonB-dependent receptor [Gammaproteobacteria bacterium]|nr:TonB-dependent receptor [Gammaproteobacteria bacterium]